MTYSDSMQQLNQNVLRPQMPQQPQVDLFGSFDIKKQQPVYSQPTTPLASSNLTTSHKVKLFFFKL